MSTAGQVTVQVSLAVIAVMVIAYSAGRVHQWYRRAFERDVAYREGYNQASHTLFALAVRKPVTRGTAGGAQPPAATGPDARARGVVSFPDLDRNDLSSTWPAFTSGGHDRNTQKGMSRS